MTRLFLKLEYAVHMVDAYLAKQRGEMAFAADCENRAREVERRLAVLTIQEIL